METKGIFYRIYSLIIFALKIILIFFSLLIIFIFGIFKFLTTYSNQYTSIENFKSNKDSFLEIKDDIVLNKFILGQGGKNHCEDKSVCEYEYKLSDDEKREKLNISYVTVSEDKSQKYFDITFNLDKKDYFQGLTPRLSFNSIGQRKSSGWYLPFPFSNKFFYIGSGYVSIDDHWSAYGYFDSAFD